MKIIHVINDTKEEVLNGFFIDTKTGKGDIFFLSAEQLSITCTYSIGKTKKVLKKLQELGFIKKLKQVVI